MSRPRLLNIVLVLIFLLGLSMNGFTYSNHFIRLTTLNGLPQNSVNYIFKDSKAQYWICTQNGLCRYNGFDFVNYSPLQTDDNLRISDVFIYKVVEDYSGLLWICTRNGIDIIKNNRVVSSLYWSENARHNQPSDLVLYKDSVLIGIHDHFLMLPQNFDAGSRKKNIENYRVNIGIPDSFLVGIYSISKDEIALLYPQKLYIKNESGTQKHQLSGMMLPDGAFHLPFYTDSSKAIFGFNNELIVYNKVTRDVVQLKLGFKLKDIIKDNLNNYWMATSDGVLVTDDQFTPITIFKNKPNDPFSISGNMVQSLLITDQNEIWVGTANKGLSIYQVRTNAFNYIPDSIFQESTVWCIDYSGNDLLAGTDKGLYVFSPNKIRSDGPQFEIKKFVPFTDKVVSISLAGNQTIVATRTNGIYFLDSHYNQTNHFEISEVNDLLVTNNELYVATDYGLYNYNLDQLNSAMGIEPEEINVSTSYILGLSRGLDSLIWISGNNGISSLNTYSSVVTNYEYHPDFTDGRSLNYFMVADAVETEDLVAIASYGGGLNILDKKTRSFYYLPFRNNAQLNLIHSILFDKDAGLWFSTGNKLVSLDSNQYYWIYDAYEGLKMEEFSFNARFLKNDTIFFGGIGGIVYFNSSYLSKVHKEVVPYVDDILINGQSNSTGTAEAASFYSGDVVELVLYYDRPNYSENEYFMYKIEGLHSEWIFSESNRILLPTSTKGSFKVLFIHPSDKDKVMEVFNYYVQIPFTQSAAFMILISLTALALIFGLIIARMRYMNQKKLRTVLSRQALLIEKERISRELHDHIGSNITHLINAISFLEKTSKETSVKNELSDLARFSKSTMVNLRSAIWSLSTEDITLQILQLKALELLRALSKHSNREISIRINLSGDKEVEISSEVAVHIIRIFQEALNNSIKHSNSTELLISIHESNKILVIDIKENGTGFDPNIQYSGSGISNMKKRAELMGSKLIIESNREGTRISFELNLNDSQ